MGGPIPSLDGKGPVDLPSVLNFGIKDIFGIFNFVYDFIDGCTMWAAIGGPLGGGAGFVAVGPLGVAPGGAAGAASFCLVGGFGTVTGLINHQPVI